MKIDVIDLRDPSAFFASDALPELAALSWRDAVWPAAFYEDSDFATVGLRQGDSTLQLFGQGLTFTASTMSGTVDRLVSYDGSGRKLMVVTDIGLALGDPAWGTPEDRFAGNDEILASDNADFIDGYGGDDRLVGRKGNDVVHGNGGDDKLVGNGGRDQLFGDGGRDLLVGGRGDDLMFGGGGKDAFRFKSVGGRDGEHNVIADFGRGNDRIELDRDAFKGLGPEGRLDPDRFATVADAGRGDKILWDGYAGKLYYDPDGSGPKDARLVTFVLGPDGVAKLDAGDIFLV